MSFNIASDGSPTPRKGISRFPTPGDLKVDTSPEALRKAVGSISLNHYPGAIQRAFGSVLTSNTQGTKQQLGPFTLCNRPLLQKQDSLDGYKVSILYTYFHALCFLVPLVKLTYEAAQYGY